MPRPKPRRARFTTPPSLNFRRGLAARQASEEPCPRGLPVAHRRRQRGAQHVSGLFQRESAEEAQFGDAGLAPIERGELVERVMEIEHVNVVRRAVARRRPQASRGPTSRTASPSSGRVPDRRGCAASSRTPWRGTARGSARRRDPGRRAEGRPRARAPSAAACDRRRSRRRNAAARRRKLIVDQPGSTDRGPRDRPGSMPREGR